MKKIIVSGLIFTLTVSYLSNNVCFAVDVAQQNPNHLKEKVMAYYLGRRSKKRLKGVHPKLSAVVERAIEISQVDFTVLEGLRTLKRQRVLVRKGASKTLRSRHLTGHAVDLGALVDGTVSWDWQFYHKIADAMKQAAKEQDVTIKWGGDWTSFKDGPHFQLSWKRYPIN